MTALNIEATVRIEPPTREVEKTNQSLACMASDHDRIQFLVALLSSCPEKWTLALGRVSYGTQCYMWTLSADRRQLRCWKMASGGVATDDVQCVGMYLLISVSGTPAGVQRYVEGLLQDCPPIMDAVGTAIYMGQPRW